MIQFKRMMMRSKLVFVFLCIGLIPVLLIGGISAYLAQEALIDESFDELSALRDNKKHEAEYYFKDMLIIAEVFARSKDVIDLYNRLFEYHESTGVKPDGTYNATSEEYRKIWETDGKIVKHFIEDTSYHDALLICFAHGHVMFSVNQENELGSNLNYGVFQDSPLAKLWKEVRKQRKMAVLDFQVAANREPSLLVGYPVMKNEEIVGIFVLELEVAAINAFMHERAGMGKTGEMYMVGPDQLMRSDSFLDPQNHSVVNSFKNPEKGKIDTEATKAALSGITDQKMILDYRGNLVLSAYTPIQIGDLKWALLVDIDKSEIMDPVFHLIGLICIFICIITVILIFVAYNISKMITNPLLKGVDFAKRVSNGDLTSTITLDQEDEVGILARSLSDMASELRLVLTDVVDTSNNLSSTSEELSTISAQLTSSANNLTDQSKTIAVAANQVSENVTIAASATEQSSSSVANIANMTEEMSSTFIEVARFSQETVNNVKAVSDASGEMSEGMTQIAAAVEELNSSLNEVSKNTAQANRISQNASKRTGDINTRMNALVNAAKQIGRVVGVIKNIADKTDMLALNATIEAASAGETGKGFAVVAGEVKELAKQSAEATEEIAGQIEQIQMSTNEAFSAINEINKIIEEIASINEMNASSIVEQTSTAGEVAKTVAGNVRMIKSIAKNANDSTELVRNIAKSMDEISKTAKQVAMHVDELSKGISDMAKSSMVSAKSVRDISGNMQGITVSAQNTASGAEQTKKSADQLAKMASVLYEIIKKFKI
ncbi:MAG: methyl-accepting chemotaxis protein [Desulfobacterales bacterium]|nr:methyl-accepting chemotaxis protein [Desulfobacterales bacterium]